MTDLSVGAEELHGIDLMRFNCAKKLQEALGLADVPTVLSVEGYGFISLSGFGKPQAQVYYQSTPGELAEFHRTLLRRVRVGVQRAVDAGVDCSRGVAIKGRHHLLDPNLINLRGLEFLERASGSELRAAYEEITGTRPPRPRARSHPLADFTPRTGSVTLPTGLGFLV